METAAGSPEKHLESRQYMMAMQTSPPSKGRLTLIADLDAAVRTSESAVDIAENMEKALRIAMIESKPEQQPSIDQLTELPEERHSEARSKMKRLALMSLLFAYKDLTAEVVRAYTAFADPCRGHPPPVGQEGV